MEEISNGQIRELSPEFLGSVSGLNPWLVNDSGSRLAMMAGHMSQALILKGAERRRVFTGDEAEYAKAVFNIDMPVTGQIIGHPIERLPASSMAAKFKFNPETAVLFESLEARREGRAELDIVNIKSHWCLHQTFGFKYRQVKHAWNMLRPNNIIEKGTVFASPPDVLEDGNWAFGINTKVAYLTIPQIIEDGFVARRGWLAKATATAIGTRMGNWGRQKYALNLYGDENNYKPFPEPGDKIREDGILFALRPYTKYLGVCDMTPEALMTPDPVFDELIFAEPGATVVDVRVMHDHSQPRPPTPFGMSDLCEKYLRAQQVYSRSLIAAYKDKKRTYPNLEVSRRLQQQLVTAIDNVPDTVGIENTTSRTYRATPLDDWTVEITYSYDHVPTVGSKITALHGNKGVIVDIWEDEDMPRDEWGNIADVIMDPDSVGKRMNDGCFYEQYVNSSMDQMTEHIRAMVRNGQQLKAFDTLVEYYGCLSSPMKFRILQSCQTEQRRLEHVNAVVKDGIYLYMPAGTVEVGATQIRNLRNNFPLQIRPVTYRGRSGNMVTTVDNVIIGSMYVILLEKTGNDWSAVASLKHQHHGVPAKLTQRDRYSYPWREQPNRSLGEAEIRLINAMVDRLVVADLLEIPNSPQAQRHIARMILSAAQPTNIDVVVDRTVIRRGYSRALLFVKHQLECMGIWFARKRG